MKNKRILIIQDISCVGQCSTTVALPILSAMGHETCVLPTALLSTHTGGFGKPVVVHFDQALPEIWKHWEQNEITFDAILVGYLGSIPAVAAAEDIIDHLLAPGGIGIVDPVMGDHGKLYSGFDQEYVRSIAGLCRKAHLILPNITEAAILAGIPYQDGTEECYVKALLDSLEYNRVVLTGVGSGPEETGAVLKDGKARWTYSHRRFGNGCHGTGDIFAAAFTGALLREKTIREALAIAGEFTGKCVENTQLYPAHWYGVRFEPLLPELMKMIEIL